MPGSIFISYRRTGGAKDARAIFERLRGELGGHRVFIDLEGIEPGEDFVDSLERQLDGCEALVVLIGPDWSGVTNEHGARRLDDENDFVRIEVGAALRRGVKVFPVLIDGALPPRASELPEDLRPLVRRQAVVLDYAKFDADVVRLARAIARALEPGVSGLPEAIPAAPIQGPTHSMVAAASIAPSVAESKASETPAPAPAVISPPPIPSVISPPPTPSTPPASDSRTPPIDLVTAPVAGASDPPEDVEIERPIGTEPRVPRDAHGKKPGWKAQQADALPGDRQDKSLRTPGLAQRGPLLLITFIGACALIWGAMTLVEKQERNKAIVAGAAIYKTANCISCHGEDGAHPIDPSYPSLSGSKLVSGPKAELVAYFANVGTMKDQAIMRGLVGPMSDESVALVGTYIRNAWKNPTDDVITATEVNAARKRRPADYVPPGLGARGSVEPLSKDELFRNGEKVYSKNCVACHQYTGRGAGPIAALDGSTLVTGPTNKLIDVILKGANNGAMPAWEKLLTYGEVASVATYIRNHWSNSAGDLVQPREVMLVAANPAFVLGVAPAPAGAGSLAVPVGVLTPKLYTQVCSVCHVAGVAGAPKLGDRAAWAPRIAKGVAAMNASVINGKGAMPPRGGSSAGDAELASVVRFMVEASK